MLGHSYKNILTERYLGPELNTGIPDMPDYIYVLATQLRDKVLDHAPVRTSGATPPATRKLCLVWMVSLSLSASSLRLPRPWTRH
jgi:hypothetical protein